MGNDQPSAITFKAEYNMGQEAFLYRHKHHLVYDILHIQYTAQSLDYNYIYLFTAVMGAFTQGTLYKTPKPATKSNNVKTG